MGLGKLVFEIGLKGVDIVRRELKNLKKDLGDTGKAAHDAGEKAKAFSGGVLHMAESLTKFTAHTALAVTGAGAIATALSLPVANAAFDAAAQMDSLTRALATYSKNGDDLTRQLSALRDIAKLPGLGIPEAVQGSIRLQAVGLSAKEAEKAIMAFGNAIASSGGGKDQLDGALLGLSQIVSRGAVTMDNINQIGNALPQIRAAMKTAFGSADSEQLQKMGITANQFVSGVVNELSKLPKVTGGIQNAIENFGDSLKDALLPLGKGMGIALDSLSGGIDNIFTIAKKASTAIGEVFAALGTSGVLSDTLKKLTGLTDGMFGADFQANIARAAAAILTVVGNIPEAFNAAKTYASSLFTTIAGDAQTIFNYIEGKATYYVTLITEFIKGVSALNDSIADTLNAPLKALEKLVTASKQGSVNGVENPSAPVLKLDPLPAMPNFLKMLGNGIDDNTAKIMANLKPLPNLPDGLLFGGGGPQETEKESQTVGVLKSIETNTKKTADVLDMRSVFGGGPLASLGVTPAELFGGRAASGGGERSQPVLQVMLGGTGGASRSVSNQLEAAVLSLLHDALQRSPRDFNPRLAGV